MPRVEAGIPALIEEAERQATIELAARGRAVPELWKKHLTQTQEPSDGRKG